MFIIIIIIFITAHLSEFSKLASKFSESYNSFTAVGESDHHSMLTSHSKAAYVYGVFRLCLAIILEGYWL